MKVPKIKNLLDSLQTTNSTSQSNRNIQEQAQEESVKLDANTAQKDAVTISNQFGQIEGSSSPKVARLKELVGAGEYNPKSEDVAKAVARDLF